MVKVVSFVEKMAIFGEFKYALNNENFVSAGTKKPFLRINLTQLHNGKRNVNQERLKKKKSVLSVDLCLVRLWRTLNRNQDPHHN